MANYVIGDVQGSWHGLSKLLNLLNFDPTVDRIWLVGDLVNRGSENVQILRFIRSLGDRARVVLGNHDIHLIRCWLGLAVPKQSDTITDVLASNDCDELVGWLCDQPLVYQEDQWTMVHAGFLPTWSLPEATGIARQVEHELRCHAKTYLANSLFPFELKVLTTIRTCHLDLTLCDHNGPLEDCSQDCFPWFSHPRSVKRPGKTLFGHWAALGYKETDDFIALDTGYVWGGALTGVRLEDYRTFQVKA